MAHFMIDFERAIGISDQGMGEDLTSLWGDPWFRCRRDSFGRKSNRFHVLILRLTHDILFLANVSRHTQSGVHRTSVGDECMVLTHLNLTDRSTCGSGGFWQATTKSVQSTTVQCSPFVVHELALFGHSLLPLHLDYQLNYVAHYIRLSLYIQGFEGTVPLLSTTRGERIGDKVL